MKTPSVIILEENTIFISAILYIFAFQAIQKMLELFKQLFFPLNFIFTKVYIIDSIWIAFLNTNHTSYITSVLSYDSAVASHISLRKKSSILACLKGEKKVQNKHEISLLFILFQCFFIQAVQSKITLVKLL